MYTATLREFVDDYGWWLDMMLTTLVSLVLMFRLDSIVEAGGSFAGIEAIYPAGAVMFSADVGMIVLLFTLARRRSALHMRVRSLRSHAYALLVPRVALIVWLMTAVAAGVILRGPAGFDPGLIVGGLPYAVLFCFAVLRWSWLSVTDLT